MLSLDICRTRFMSSVITSLPRSDRGPAWVRSTVRAAFVGLAVAAMLAGCSRSKPMPIGQSPVAQQAAMAAAAPPRGPLDGSVHPQRHESLAHPQRNVPAYPGWEIPAALRMSR